MRNLYQGYLCLPAGRVKSINLIAYYYRQNREGSLIREKNKNSLSGYLKTCDSLINFLQEKKFEKKELRALYIKITSLAYTPVHYVIVDDDYRELKEEIISKFNEKNYLKYFLLSRRPAFIIRYFLLKFKSVKLIIFYEKLADLFKDIYYWIKSNITNIKGRK